ncbi:MAG TPA: tRNA (guanosine(37)-N1)-methyltransferase TrmD [Eubacteriaceae bacterium]|nr:tRNA (guanosine(37)-N1)-methyltransferase TrmD [Eubacteriaceae bacterium]
MTFYLLTLFPEIFSNFLSMGFVKKAMDERILHVEVINIRDFSENKHKKTDDYPFGGGPGMVLTPQPVGSAIEYVKEKSPKVKTVYLSPKGSTYNQDKAHEIKEDPYDYILLCGHYEGLDQRIIDRYVDEEISMGDFILTGGEIPAMAIIDSVSRLFEGVLGNSDSIEEESFSSCLLEYPQYTRPRCYDGMEVPDVLLSGDHKKIEQWRQEQSIKETKAKRPDLYQKYLKNKKND